MPQPLYYRGNMEKEVLTLAEAARYLKVSEKTIRRLIDEDAIPCAKVGGQWRFMKQTIQQWLQSQMKVVPQQAYLNTLIQKEAISLSSLIDPVCVFWDMDAKTSQSVLYTLSQSLQDAGAVENTGQFLVQLLEREKMMSTGIGNGIALPHARLSGQPPVLRSALAIGFVREGIDFSAIDGAKTHLFVVIASHTDPVHLRILSFFSKIAGNKNFLPSLMALRNKNDFLSFLVDQESEAIGL